VMNPCESFRQEFDACRDQTLALDRQCEIETHLASCDQCRTEYQRAGSIETGIRQHAETWQPSPDLWQRIEASTERRAARPGLSRSPLPWMAAALLMLTVGITSFIQLQPGDDDATEVIAAALINEFHTFVASHRALDFSDTQPAKIRNWFGDKVDFRVPLPVKSDDLQLAGGRLCNMFDQRIASFMYQVDDAWVSLYIMRSPPATQNSDASRELLMKGYGFIDWEHQGLHYSLVGDLPVARLRQIARDLRLTRILTRAHRVQRSPVAYVSYDGLLITDHT
jgi:anti-sigma factor RsiW